MGLFDRFTSRKGKEEKVAPQRGVVKPSKPSKDDEEKKAFASVPSGKEEKKAEPKAEKAKDQKPAAGDAKSTATNKEATDRAHAVLIRPVITEKSTRLAKLNQYVFIVRPEATKADVCQAIYHVYDVHPIDATIINLPGKAVRYGRYEGRQPSRRKAIVTLPAGKTIDVTNG